uniref:Proteasome assembly chaperone 4 n=1 Tax=Oryza barthii TaxID=65489 RepID=A0A0D3HS39_9ORYZ
MASEELRTSFSDLVVGSSSRTDSQVESSGDPSSEGGVQVTCFTEDLHDVILHFQIIRFSKQIYAWVGCNTAKFGHLYAAASTRPGNGVSVTSVLGGTSDNTGSGMARRLVLKTGLNIVLACNIPKDSPMLEAAAERKLIEKLRGLGYVRPRAGEDNTSTAQ